MVFLIARRALGSESEVEDIGQEVFDRVFRKVRTLREPDKFRSFIYACAVRVLQTELRHRKLRSWLSLDRPETLAGLGCQTLDLEWREILRKFQALLDRLTPRDRLVFVLRRMESMTIEQIAATMKVSESTVKRSMARAAKRLSRWIDADPGLAGLFDGGRLER
jgi:RNA polymerase sigma-70 factor (ECF subfamily)